MPTGQADRLMPTLRRVVLARQSAARSDGDLLGAFVTSRDAEAFAELVRRHGPMVLGVCRRVVGHRATADDAFQAAFLVLARRAASVRPRERVGNWLYGVAYRTALKARTVLARRRSREKQVDVMPEPIAPAAPAPAWTDLQPVIDEELARLPDKLRLPVVLCDLEGRPQREVAKHLNVPPATLATRLATARRTLAERLTRRGVTLSGGALAGLLGAHASASAVPRALAAGVVRAVEAVATGGALNSLVSVQAVQLSEGVMQMMMLAKLKAVAVMAAVALALTTGLGVGLMPAAAGDEPGTGAPARAKAGGPPAAPTGSLDNHIAGRPKDRGAPEPGTDDTTFLRRLCLDVRGTPPTEVEQWFFASDGDDDKRAKLVDWMTEDDAAKLALAKRLGVPPDRIRVVRARLSADGRYVELLVEATGERVVKPLNLKINMNAPERITDVATALTNPDAALTARTLAVWSAPDVKTAKPATVEQVYTWKRFDTLDDTTGKLLQDAPTERLQVWDFATDGKKAFTAADIVVNEWFAVFDDDDTDAEFLKRVLLDVRGSGPTALERKYFGEDKDPKKREKLIDTLLKDPAVQKKLGDEWKKKMLALKPATFKYYKYLKADQLFRYVKPKPDVLLWKEIPNVPVPPVPPAPPAAPQADRLEKLVGELLAAKKSDEAVLEAVTLATLSRLPTDSEKKLVLASIGNAADRKAAWVAVAKALAGTDGAKKPDTFQFHFEPPVPAAKP